MVQVPPLEEVLSPIRSACEAKVEVDALVVPSSSVPAARTLALAAGDLFPTSDVVWTNSAVNARATSGELRVEWRGLKTVLPAPADAPQGSRLVLFPRSASIPDDSALASVSRITYTLDLGYTNLPAASVLAVALPAGTVVPTAFETVGHLAHLNLKEDVIPFKFIVGAVILDKHAHIKTVVNKTGAIEGEFRVLPMEIIAGDGGTQVVVKESGCEYELDYATVYWNSRLSGEHERVVRRAMAAGPAPSRAAQPGNESIWIAEHSAAAQEAAAGAAGAARAAPVEEGVGSVVICDLFAGIGPFAVPAGRAGARVIANDLNPESVHWMRRNARRNRVAQKVAPSCADARALVGDLAAAGVCVDDFIMNLPPLGPEFCDAFRGSCRHYGPGLLPRVFCHGFAPTSNVEEAREHIEKRVADALGCTVTELHKTLIETRAVRLVAPHKWMLCCEFNIPESVGRMELSNE